MKKLFGLLFFVILGCGPVIKEGTITDKSYTAAHTSTYTTMEEFIPDSGIYIPKEHTIHHPDRWSITFQKFNEEKNAFDTRTVEVSKQTYDEFENGKWIKFD